MNIQFTPVPRLVIEVVQDFVCPWCRIGARRLLTALARRPEFVASVVWRPFLLNPDIAQSGMPRAEYMARKFGGEERVRRLQASISEIGRGNRLEFHFERIRRVRSSLDAHRLVRWAGRQGGGGELAGLVEGLFTAHFAEGFDIGDHGVLAALAARHGFDGRAALLYLAEGSDRDAIVAENLRAHRQGINGVPCLLIAGRHAIAGAQEAEVIDRLLDVALVEALEEMADPLRPEGAL